MPQSEKSIVLSKVTHRQEVAVSAYFEYDVELDNKVKRLKKIQCRQTTKRWNLLNQGVNLRAIQNLPRQQENILTTEIYTHISNVEIQKVISPINEIIREA